MRKLNISILILGILTALLTFIYLVSKFLIHMIIISFTILVVLLFSSFIISFINFIRKKKKEREEKLREEIIRELNFDKEIKKEDDGLYDVK